MQKFWTCMVFLLLETSRISLVKLQLKWEVFSLKCGSFIVSGVEKCPEETNTPQVPTNSHTIAKNSKAKHFDEEESKINIVIPIVCAIVFILLVGSACFVSYRKRSIWFHRLTCQTCQQHTENIENYHMNESQEPCIV